MSRNGTVQNRKRDVPESGVHNMNKPLKKESPIGPTGQQRSSTTGSTTGSYLVPLAVVLTLLGAVWLARVYYPVTDPIPDLVTDPRPYAVCARHKSVIFTVDGVRPTAQCMLVDKQGRIADIGSEGT